MPSQPTRVAAPARNAVGSVNTPTIQSTVDGQPKNLWDKAIKTLSHRDREQIDFCHSDRRDILNDVLVMVKVKKDQCMLNRWKYKKSNGEDVILRDLFEKMAKWVNKFKEFGDVAVQYDPAHAALPWAGVRFLLQVAVNDTETFGAMIEGLEHVSNLITRYAIFENLYLHRASALKNQLAESIIRLYATVLIYLSNASRYYNLNTGQRIARSVLHAADASVDVYLRRISEEKGKVDDLAYLVDAEYQRNMSHEVNIVSDNVQALQLDLNVQVSTLANELGNMSEEVRGLQTSVESREIRMRHKLEQILHTLDEPILRMADLLLGVQDNLEREERLKIFRWISTIPYREHHRTLSKDVLPNSGLWLRKKPEFIEWRKSSISSVLWLHGIPGSGKTKLTSTIIQNILEENTTNQFAAPIAYFYCTRNEAEKQRAEPEEILRSILKQLSCSKPDLPMKEPVVREYQKRREDAEEDGSEPVKLSVEESTELIIALIGYNPATIVIDALDECQPSRRYELLTALNDIINKSANIVKIFVSSRDDIDIVLTLAEAPNIFIDARDNSKDIQRFVHFEVQRAITDRRLLRGQVSDNLKNQVITALIKGASGMFRWVSLQIQNLCDSRRMKIEDDVSDELGRLPQTLADLYAVTYEQIAQTGSKGRSIVERTLKWLLCAEKSLSAKEFIAAVSVSSEGEYISLSKAKILDLCCNLVILDTELDTFRFAHLSVREYLESRPEFTVNETNALVVERCLEVYLHDQKGVRTLEPTAEQHNILRQYAALYWTVHYQKLDENRRRDCFKARVEFFLFKGLYVNPSFTAWTEDATQKCESLYLDELLKDRLTAISSSPPTPLYMACIFGLSEILEKLILFKNTIWNQKNCKGSTALHLAAQQGHKVVVQLLLEQGTDVAAKDRDGWTALHLTVRYGYEAILQLLLEKGADVTAKGRHGWTALHWAAYHGYETVARLLLENGANVSVKERDGWTALHLAARHGHDAVVQLLLQKEPNIAEEDKDGWTALHFAARYGQMSVVLLLLEKQADIIAEDRDGWTALYLAARYGHAVVVRILLEKGPNIVRVDRYGWTLLHWAAREGHETVVQLVIEKGANVAVSGSDGWTALHWAACYGHEVVVRLLLEKGANALAEDRRGQTALHLATCGHWAACFEHEAIVRLLTPLTGDVYSHPAD